MLYKLSIIRDEDELALMAKETKMRTEIQIRLPYPGTALAENTVDSKRPPSTVRPFPLRTTGPLLWQTVVLMISHILLLSVIKRLKVKATTKVSQ